KTTHRETTENDDHFGPVSDPQKKASIVYDPSDLARTTIRETTEHDDHVGPVSDPARQGSRVYDPFDIARCTHRETMSEDDHVGPVGASYLQNGLGYEIAPDDVKNTQRQFYSDFYYTGTAGQADAPENQQLYDY